KKKTAAKPAAKTIPKPPAKPAAKKPAAKKPTATKPAVKKDSMEKVIPKPPSIKKAVTEKPPAKSTARPSVKKPVAEPVTKPLVSHVKISASPSTLKEIKRARAVPKIKPKRKSTPKKAKKKVKMSPTYGVVRNVVHDRTGRTKNRSVIISLDKTEAPLASYLGKRVRVQMKTGKVLIGVISRIHGRRTSNENTVVVRFSKSVSPHIVTSRAEVL
ncbi:MAG: hypothetical protein ACXAAM_03995, partial [Candidatus Heimdallarchaeaceae archaeon]